MDFHIQYIRAKRIDFFFFLVLQVGGVVALCAHPPVLGHDSQMSVLRQDIQRPVCVLSAAAAVQEGPS